jgi:hypothetical protein
MEQRGTRNRHAVAPDGSNWLELSWSEWCEADTQPQVLPCQGEGRGFESRRPLARKSCWLGLFGPFRGSPLGGFGKPVGSPKQELSAPADLTAWPLRCAKLLSVRDPYRLANNPPSNLLHLTRTLALGTGH